jgi:hypothetical protein
MENDRYCRCICVCVCVGVCMTACKRRHFPQRSFGGLSRRAKQTTVIGSSKAWMRLAAKVKQQTNKHKVVWMDRTKFRDWKVRIAFVCFCLQTSGFCFVVSSQAYLNAKYQRPSEWKDTDGHRVPFMKIRWFNFGQMFVLLIIVIIIILIIMHHPQAWVRK